MRGRYTGDPGSVFLPNACTGRAVLTMLLITELVAVVLTLAGAVGGQPLWERLIMLSLYLQWIGLCSAAILCQARSWLQGYTGMSVALVAFALLLLVTWVISEFAYWAGNWRPLTPFFVGVERSEFLLRSLGICAIVAAAALRYFWVQNSWRGQVESEAEARYQALQARIRPHFLFNSLNSIAALVGVNPKEAERAVEDLAELFRVGITTRDRRITLKEELDITRAYVRTEYLRLGSRLKLRWDIDPNTLELLVLPLSIQPLLENAVYHGIEQMPEGGVIEVTIEELADKLVISISNPVPAAAKASSGTRIALDNIRQRLRIMYGDDASLQSGVKDGQFNTRLVFPVQEEDEEYAE